jgi:hypothetical protein
MKPVARAALMMTFAIAPAPLFACQAAAPGPRTISPATPLRATSGAAFVRPVLGQRGRRGVASPAPAGAPR